MLSLHLLMGIRGRLGTGVVFLEANGVKLRGIPRAAVVFGNDLLALFATIDPGQTISLDHLRSSDFIPLQDYQSPQGCWGEEKLVLQHAALALCNLFLGLTQTPKNFFYFTRRCSTDETFPVLLHRVH